MVEESAPRRVLYFQYVDVGWGLLTVNDLQACTQYGRSREKLETMDRTSFFSVTFDSQQRSVQWSLVRRSPITVRKKAVVPHCHIDSALDERFEKHLSVTVTVTVSHIQPRSQH